MITIETSTIINRPVEEVFEFTVSSENDVHWQSGVVEAIQTSEGPMEIGATFMQEIQFLGRRVISTFVVTAYHLNEKFGFKMVSGPIPMDGSFIYESTEEGHTKFTMQAVAEVGGFFKLAEPLVSRIAQRDWETNFSNLKDILEAAD